MTTTVPLRVKKSFESEQQSKSSLTIGSSAATETSTKDDTASVTSMPARTPRRYTEEQQRLRKSMPIPIPPTPKHSNSPSPPTHHSPPVKTQRCPHCGMLRRTPLPFTERGTSPPRSHPSLLFQQPDPHSISQSPVEQCCEQDVFYPDIAMPDDMTRVRDYTRRASTLAITESPPSQ